MADQPHHILKRFPDIGHTLMRLMAKDAEFHSLCEDYEMCVDALSYWSRAEAPEAEIRTNEYQTLVRELEQEIAAFLAKIKTQQAD